MLTTPHVPFRPPYAKKPAHWSCLLQGYHKRWFHAALQKESPNKPPKISILNTIQPNVSQHPSVLMLNVGISSRSEIPPPQSVWFINKAELHELRLASFKAVSLCFAVGANVVLSSDVERESFQEWRAGRVAGSTCVLGDSHARSVLRSSSNV